VGRSSWAAFLQWSIGMFDLYSGVLRHAGKRSYEIAKDNLTAPEIVILRAIHGNETVVSVKRTGKRDIKNFKNRPELLTNSGELERLRNIYYPYKFDEDKNIVDTLWPGFNPQLPLVLDGYSEDRVLAKELA
jgi:hypothetical protein